MNSPAAASSVLFGTDGVRGRPGTPPLDESTLVRLGTAIVLSLPRSTRTRRVLIGRDTRESGPWITKRLVRGLAGGGAEVTDGGLLSTPAVAFLTRDGGFDAGIVVSASHNPFQDNGVKVFTGAGEKADDALESSIAALTDDVTVAAAASTCEMRGAPCLIDRYVSHTQRMLSGIAVPSDLRIAIDCANGATSRIAPAVLRGLGLDPIVLYDQPDGRNINLECGSIHPAGLARAVVDRQCRLGAAFDGDGDRVVFVDHHGTVVDGDAVLLIAARSLAASGRLPRNGVVATVMSNVGLERALRADAITVHRCPVGDRFVWNEMAKRGLALGGEQSGHIIVTDHLSTGDGLAVALLILRALVTTGRELRELAADLMPSPQVHMDVRVRQRVPLHELTAVSRLVAAAERELADQGRVLVRYSGTERLLRIMIEGPDREVIEALANGIAVQARADLGGGDN